MTKKIALPSESHFTTAREDAECVCYDDESLQAGSPSYRLAYDDLDFIKRDELRPVRLQLELLKPELIQQEHRIRATVVVFGSARIPDAESAKTNLINAERALRLNPDDPKLKRRVAVSRRVLEKSRYYDEARELGRLITEEAKKLDNALVVATGGGPGIMEAANRGASDACGKSIGLNIVLPAEQRPNKYITPELCFQFHYFAIRKMHFLIRAVALVAFPGGYGTLDELFETLTLIQTKKVRPVPVILFGRQYWEKIVNFDALLEEGSISEEDLALIRYAETAEEAWKIIFDDYSANNSNH
ncbi:MAG: LOG family protein [Gammaproteobacteria bacterium]